MAAGKLVLLLVAGGLAGAAFAGLNSGAMRPFRVAPDAALSPHSQRDAYAGPPEHASSWLDEGLSALDSPAWPFGRGGWSREPAPEPLPYGYAPPEEDGKDEYGTADSGENYGAGDYADGDSTPAYRRDAPVEDSGQDAAASAAGHAADAAKDVIAAENNP